MHFGVGRVRRLWPRVVDEIAVEIDVVLVGAPPVREAVGIHRVHEKHRGAAGARTRQEPGVLQQRDLGTGATEALDAVRAAAEHQEALGLRRAEPRAIERQFLAIDAAGLRVDMALERQPAGRRPCDEVRPRLSVALREMACAQAAA